MEDWKRMYSNNDTKSVALPYFWQHFDKENYSLWSCEYKYADELKLIFMTCNLVEGEIEGHSIRIFPIFSSLSVIIPWFLTSCSHGKSWNFSKSWKVMENGESHGKVMEF